MRMKFLRILPETCASTWCLFSNSTLNIALGSGSRTVAITSIASSLLIRSLYSLLLLRQNHWTVFRHCHAVFEVRAETAVGGYRGPFVAQHPGFGLAEVHHRLDRNHHSFAQLGTVTARAIVRNLGFFVQVRADSVSHKLAHYAESGGFDMFLHRRAHVADGIANHGILNPAVERLFGYRQQLLQFFLYRVADRNRDRRVAIVAVQNHAAIDRNNVAFFQDPFFRRDAVHDLVIHRRAEHARVIVVSLERGLGAKFDDFIFGGSLQVHRGYAGRDQRSQVVQYLADDAATLPHLVNLRRRFANNCHGSKSYAS